MHSTDQGTSRHDGHRVYMGTHEGDPMRAKIIITALVLATLCTAYNWGTETTRTCTVTDTDRTYGKDHHANGYRIETDCGTLAVGSLIRGPWDTDQLYQSIEPGRAYTFTTIGWDFLPGHPAIIRVEPTKGTT